jgi:hypothetical protein
MAVNILLEMPTSEFCSPDRHVFETRGRLPVPDEQKCWCGKTTWAQAVQAAWHRLQSGQGEPGTTPEQSQTKHSHL